MISGQVGIILYYIKNRRLWSTVNAKEEVEKTEYNIRLTKIIEDVFAE